MHRISFIALGVALSCAPTIALAQNDAAPGLEPNRFQCLAKSPVTDFLCFSPADDDAPEPDEPWMSFASINQFGQLTGDFDQQDDIRDFTSEALFSASPIRLNRPLTEAELQGVARVKPQWETFNRVSFGAPGLPILDIGYRHRNIDDAQITNFFVPTSFNEVEVDEYSVGLRYGDLSPERPYHVQLTYRRAERSGLIEFVPDNDEEVDEIEFDLALGSRDTSVDFTYVRQDIDQNTAFPIDRARDILAARVRHTLSGGQIFAGGVFDSETFGSAEVQRTDFYVGGVAYGVHAMSAGIVDLGLQGTRFTSEVDNDDSQDNAQFRTNAFVRLHARDWRYAVTIPFAYDVAVDGLDAFENYRVGLDITVRTNLGDSEGRQPTLLASLRLEHEEFINIDESADTILARLAVAL